MRSPSLPPSVHRYRGVSRLRLRELWSVTAAEARAFAVVVLVMLAVYGLASLVTDLLR